MFSAVAATLAALMFAPAQTSTPALTPALEHIHPAHHTTASEAPTEIAGLTSATAALKLNRSTLFVDPVGSKALYAAFGRPDIVVLTSTEQSHLSINTMIGMLGRDTVVLAPQAVINRLPLMISNNTIAPFNPGSTQIVDGIRFTALKADAPLPEGTYAHERTRGQIAVLVEWEGHRLAF